jgi:flavin reductase (DIM6/NTAB) family NADH-FMN oxidoreductase RutF
MHPNAPFELARAPFDSRAFHDALGTFPTGVALVTTIDADGRPIGLTGNSFGSVSLDPPLESWGLRRPSKSLESFRQAEVFAINILAQDQKDLSSRFASSQIADKFEGRHFHAGIAGCR